MEKIHSDKWASLPLRLIVGYGFIAHGFAKLSKGPEAFASILQQLAVPMPHLSAWLTIITEIVGGLAVLLGVFLPWASIPMAIVLITAAIKVHLPFGFSSIKLLSVSASGAKFGPVGYETNLLYLAALATLVLLGSGHPSMQVSGAPQTEKVAAKADADDHLINAGVK